MKSVIREWEPDLISLNHLFYTSAVISIELCGVKMKEMFLKTYLGGTHSETNRHSSFWLKNVQNDNNVKISKSRKLRAKYEIKGPEEIQTALEKVKHTNEAEATR